MKSTASNRSIGKTRQRLALRPVAAACVTVLMAAGAAQAQQADESGQTVVVTGIRRGIESSVATKRNADTIVEAVSSEDIGKLPDVSIAESLARLPGLTAQRVAGRAQVISIRGLPPDFIGTLLNGREQVSTGDNRSVEFDQFPSELLSSVVVHKTPMATLVGQGLAGTVNMKTIRPLDLSARNITLNARVESNSNGTLNSGSSATGNRLSFSYIDQFANRTIGVALGVAHLDTPGQELHYKAWGFQDDSNCLSHPEWGCGPVVGLPKNATYLNGFEVEATSRTQKRDGLMGVFEYKPSKDLHSTVDLYYSKFKKTETMRGLMGSLGDGWSGLTSGNTVSNVHTIPVAGSTTFMDSATFGNVTNMVVRNDLNTRDDTLKSLGWNTEAKFGGGWSAVADLSYSNAKRQENVIETYAGVGAAKGGFAVTVPTGGGFPTLVPSLNYADATTVKLSDPAGWGHDGLWKKPKSDDTIKAMRLEGKKELEGPFTGLDFGVNYTTRTKFREMNEQTTNLKNGRAAILAPGDILQPTTSLGFAGIPGVLTYDVMGALNKYYDVAPTAQDQVTSRNYDVSEKVSTAYVKVDFESALGKLPVHGNFGLQLVHTDQSSNGWSKLSGTYSQVSNGATYNDVLPSVNMDFDLGTDWRLRVAAAKTMSRGRMDDMRAGADVNITKDATSGLTTWSGSGGNPWLQPWRDKSLDLSLEKYLGKRSYVAAAAFYKRLDSYIYSQQLVGDFSAFPNTTNLATPVNPLGLYTRPANGQGGNVTGFELSTSLDAGLLDKSLTGFGVLASGSYTDSRIHPDGPGTTAKLPGLSGITGGLTVFYEQNGFSARISNRYRSAFRGEVTGLYNARSFTDILADKQIDTQVSYEFQSGSLKGLQILLQVNNLTNSPYATKQGTALGDIVAPQEYNKYGRQTLLGLNYKI